MRLKSTASLAALLAAGAALSMNASAFAHGAIDQEQPDLRGLASKASMIVWGDVVDISYKNSEPTEEEPNGVPHTFVTYKLRETIRGAGGKFGATPAGRAVGQAIKGKAAAAATGQIVLRFIGGADGRGGVYTETTTPVFARGQSDILFIEGGALDDCPLVACVDGRFRVADNMVYNAWGVPVVEASKMLVIGGRPNLSLLKMELPRPSFDGLMTRPEVKEMLGQQFGGVATEDLRKRYEAEAPAGSVVSYEVSTDHGTEEKGIKSPPIRRFGKAMPATAFLAAVRAAVQGVPAPTVAVQFADPRAPIRVAPPKAMSFQAAIEDIKRGDVEQREFDSLKEGDDGGKPTLQRLPLDRPQLQPLKPGGTQEGAPEPTEEGEIQ